MTLDASLVTFAILGAAMLAGAIVVVFVRDVMRMGLGLGTFLVGAAGMYLYFGLGFLAVAQVFLYVGGVLVLVLFAVMLLQRREDGRIGLESRHDIGSMFVAGGVFALIVLAFWRLRPDLSTSVEPAGVEALADALLGPLLPHFEAAGVLLLAALIAVLAVTGGERR
jgi:NADH:ubiquinone oxidoreductase subunit 6 (subunit J)